MLNNRLLHRTARQSSRGGFTLVELLVVIAIIAILAGVALGPITAGIKKAQQSGGVQNARSLALAEFQYASDNSQLYPFGADASNIADLLVAGGYISDPSSFIIPGSSETKYTGSATMPNYMKTNVSWDFGEVTATQGLPPTAPDEAPLVLSSGGTGLSFGTANMAVTATIATTTPYGTTGMAVCYKSNSAKFVLATTTTSMTVNVTSAAWPGYTMIMAIGGG
jgi:prepilin-type N-terminal cleavage/methylation domain-containing protein